MCLHMRRWSTQNTPTSPGLLCTPSLAVGTLMTVMLAASRSYTTCVFCVPAGGTFTCADALVMSAAGSNVRIDLTSIALTGGATVDLTSCSPTKTALPSTGSPWVLDPSVPAATSMTCSINNPTLDQSHFEAGSISWGVTVGAAAKGSNNTVNGDYSATFDKALTQERKYQLGIKRVDLNDDGGTAAVITTGGL